MSQTKIISFEGLMLSIETDKEFKEGGECTFTMFDDEIETVIDFDSSRVTFNIRLTEEDMLELRDELVRMYGEAP